MIRVTIQMISYASDRAVGKPWVKIFKTEPEMHQYFISLFEKNGEQFGYDTYQEEI